MQVRGRMEPVAEKWTPERRRELTRTALVSAAAELSAERGFHAASLDEIAERAGFPGGAIYSNFENKEELFFAVLERHVNPSLGAFARLIDQHGGPGTVDTSALAKTWREAAGDEQWGAPSLGVSLSALPHPAGRERPVAQEHNRRDVQGPFVTDTT